MLDPALIMLWGVTTQRVHAWARHQEGGSELTGTAASPGVVEGLARVVKNVGEIGDVRDGEILVCSITSPAWAPIFSKITAAVTDIGGVMSHAAIVCREYALPGRRRHGPRDVADQDRPAHPRRRLRRDGDDPRVRAPHASARGAPARRRRDVRRQELDASASCSPRASPCRRASPSRPRRSARSSSEAGLGGTIAAELARVSPDDVDSVGAASHAIGEAMRSAPVPGRAARRGRAARYAELGEPPVAVRSSALGEDSQDATFAGQQETYLWVRGAEQVCDAVRDCWVSLYSAPAIATAPASATDERRRWASPCS